MDEPAEVSPANWPWGYDETRAAPMRAVLTQILEACLAFASPP
jgi:formiminoglutamase